MGGEIVNVRFCEVISIIDNDDADRIKVRLYPEDNNIKSIDDIPYAFPLLPKMLHVKPKKGEGVLLFLSVANDGNSQRYYLGPVISQDQNLYEEAFFMGADSFMKGSVKKLEAALSTKPSAIGVLPNDDDVVVRGRKNADIQITNDDVRIKAGVKIVNEANKYDVKFNEINPSYFKLKYNVSGIFKESDLTGDEEVKQCNSTATIVADKINLLSNNSNEITFETRDRTDLITDDELKRVIKEAYKLPYGEKLVNLLSVFIEAFIKHTHSFPMEEPCNANKIPELVELKATLLDDKQILSDTVRIN